MTVTDLKGRKVKLIMEIEVDIEKETDWIETIENRVGDEEFDESSFKFFVRENYQDILEMRDFENVMKIEFV